MCGYRFVTVNVPVLVARLGAHPALDFFHARPGCLEPDADQERHVDLALDRALRGRSRIEPAQTRFEGVDLRLVDEIGFGEHEPIRECSLLHRLLQRVELADAVHCVHQSHDAVEAVLRLEHGVGQSASA